MTAPTTAAAYRTPPDSRTLNAWICWLLARHPATASTLVSLGWFSRNRLAGKRLRRLAERKRVRLVGSINRGLGRPEHVFCGWQPPAEHLLPEVRLTELFLRLHAGKIERGPHVLDTAIRPDAEVWIHGTVYYLELDRGPIGIDEFAQRLRAYEHCPHPSLWLCATEDRCEVLRQRAGSLPGAALFTTLTEALRGPHAEIWRSPHGGRASLPREMIDNRAYGTEKESSRDTRGGETLAQNRHV